MSQHSNEYFDSIFKLVKEAGEMLREFVDGIKEYEQKSCDVDLVTEIDQKVEKFLIENLSKKFPDHRFIGEESTAGGVKCALTDAPTWVIDPVDGTMNFIHGFPHSCISVGLLIKQVPVIGIIYNPLLEQLFTAETGKGAFLNGRQIRVSEVKDLSKALLVSELGTSRDKEKMAVVYENFKNLSSLAHGIRTLGSAALNMSMVALGGADAYFEFGIHAWDMAAGAVLIREAGGVCIDPAGGPFDIMSRRMLIASSDELAQQIVQKLVQFYPERD